ncbi:MAG: hypothetical protein HOH03_09350 [Candidatus Marinimicrobia bacterium]|nr:hypothetical protein [Candidatus Neomarinimicrobiota bacterium]
MKNLLFVFGLLVFMSCEDGKEGVEGEDGLNLLVSMETEQAGTNCENGGTKVSFGYDQNGDGILASTEITSNTYVCNGSDGSNGNDGVANITTEIIELTGNNTEYVGDNDNGYLLYSSNSPLISDDVLENGLVVVEMSPSNDPYVWYSLPIVMFDGDNLGVDYIYTNEFAYEEGSVGISWWCSFDRSAQDWLGISSLWSNYYKISIITPTE